MSFSPLPRILIADLARPGGGPVVDLGCGDGRFGARLRVHAEHVVGLDRSRAPHVRADVVADLLRPPLAPASCGVLVAANALRHLPDPAPALARWRETLRPDGRLWILEDEPAAGDGPGALYRDLQAWLRRRGPAGRGPLMARRVCEEAVAGQAGWRWGRFRNREDLRDPAALRDLVGAAAAGGDAEAAALAVRLAAEPFSYGDAWWARWCGEEDT